MIFENLKVKGKIKNTNTDVYIIPMGNNIQAMKIARDLRNDNINTDIEMNGKKLKKALDYANVESIPFVIIVGDDELEKGKVIIKNMETGLQMKVGIENITDKLKKC